MIGSEDEDGPIAVSRRGLIAGIFMLPAASQAKAETDLYEKVRRDAEQLAASMAAIDGKRYWIHVDCDSGLAAVSRVLS